MMTGIYKIFSFKFQIHVTYNWVLSTTVPSSNTMPVSKPTSKPSTMQAMHVNTQIHCEKVNILSIYISTHPVT